VRSVADALGQRNREALAAMTPAERVQLALRLGDEDVERFRRAHGLDEASARREIGRRRQTGRSRSAAVEGLLG
jgi:hypothetical protein